MTVHWRYDNLVALVLPVLLFVAPTQGHTEQLGLDGLIYRSDEDHTYGCLETLQSEIYSTRPELKPFDFKDLEIVKDFEEAEEKTQNFYCPANQKGNCLIFGDDFLEHYFHIIDQLKIRRLPTRFEHPLAFWILENVSNEIRRAIPGSADIAFPPIGTFPTGDLNAWAIPVPNKKCDLPESSSGAQKTYIIALNLGFINFATILSKIAVESLSITETEGIIEISYSRSDIDEVIRENPEIVQRFGLALISILFSLDPQSTVPHHFLPELYALPMNFLRHGLELFVVGHEFSHTLLQHDTESRVTSKVRSLLPGLSATQSNEVSAPPLELSLLSRSQEQELEADLLGLQLTLAALNSEENDQLPLKRLFGVWGADLFFSVLEVVEKAKSKIFTRPTSDETTHPPAALRRQLVRTMLAEQGFLEQSDSTATDLGSAFHHIITSLWEKSEPDILLTARLLFERFQGNDRQ